MESKVKVFELVLKSDILDGNLADNLVIDTSVLPLPDKAINYKLTVDFSQARIEDEAQIMAYPVEDKPFIKNSSYKDRIGHALSKQLKNIGSRFTALGYDVKNFFITGELFEEKDQIVISLFEGEAKEFDKKGKPTGFKVYSIVPSAPGLNKIIAETLAQMALERKKEKLLEEKKRAEHVPNNADVSTLFELIACGVYMDQRLTKENEEALVQETAASMMTCFTVHKEWPLEMSGHIGGKSQGECTIQQVDYSEWMVYSQEKEGIWSLKAAESADEAMKVIERDIVKKSTEKVVVLHHLIPVPYSLMAHGKLGFSLIEKKDAPQHKHVQVVWGKGA